jgi:nucleotide-binding universal stress UspA family protein
MLKKDFKIVVPTDFSDGSSMAMKFALSLGDNPAAVTAVHAIDPFRYQYGEPKTGRVEKQLAWTRSQTSMANWREKGGFSACNSAVIEGEPAPAITAFAIGKACDMLVLATSGRKSARKLVFGSVAEEIYREARCPVLVLGPKCSFPPRKLSRAVFATDLEPHSLAALPAILRLCARFQWSLWVVRAIPNGASTEPSRVAKEMKSRLEASADAGLCSRIAGFRADFGPPVKVILNSAHLLRAGVILMGIRSGGLLTRAATHIPWAIAQRVIAEAKCPVLTVRAHHDAI